MLMPLTNPINKVINKVYNHLFSRYGEQYWWPAEDAFEVMVGAILTQNTAWTNVEKAIINLRCANALSPQQILDTEDHVLAQWLRPSGYFNIKATRLKNFCTWYVAQGSWQGLQAQETSVLRKALLSVSGIGPETADDILLYAFDRPIFVIDAYTKRILQRLGLIEGDENYHELQEIMHQALTADVQMFKEYHALVVVHAKEHCRTKPICDDCCLVNLCKFQDRD